MHVWCIHVWWYMRVWYICRNQRITSWSQFFFFFFLYHVHPKALAQIIRLGDRYSNHSANTVTYELVRL